MYMTAQLLSEQARPSHFTLAPTNMGSSCPFPTTKATHHDRHRHRHRHTANTRRPPHLNLIKVILADSSCNITLTMHMAMSLAQPFCSSNQVNYICRWPLSSITCSCSFTNKTQQTEAKSLQIPSTKKKETSQQLAMISTKSIAQLVKKWQRMPALGRKRIAWPAAAKETDECCTSVAGKGHCAVYTTDGVRFEVPLACLGTAVFAELLRMSREEFGFGGDGGRITLPCEAAVMEYVMCLLRKGATAEVEKAFLSTMAMSCHSANHVAPYMAACC